MGGARGGGQRTTKYAGPQPPESASASSCRADSCPSARFKFKIQSDPVSSHGQSHDVDGESTAAAETTHFALPMVSFVLIYIFIRLSDVSGDPLTTMRCRFVFHADGAFSCRDTRYQVLRRPNNESDSCHCIGILSGARVCSEWG